MLIFQPYPTGGLRMSSKLTSKLHRGDLGPDLDNGEAAELDIENSRQEAQELQEEEATNPDGTESGPDPNEDVAIHFEVKTVGYMQAVSATMKGRRPTDEDRLTTLEQLNDNAFFLGLFDGHGGAETAEYLKHNAHQMIAKAVDARHKQPLEFDEEVIADACTEMDKKLIADRVCNNSGSTAAMLVVERDILAADSFKVHSIFVGDSRIIVLKFDGAPISLTQDHKPELPEEAARIEAAGGGVYQVGGVWRVGGVLALSRAFGDAMFKDYTARPAAEQQVVAVPGQRTESIPITSLILLACDGLFETVDKDLEEVLKSALAESNGGLVGALRSLMLTAYDRGSGDNISVIAATMHSELPPPSHRQFVVGRNDAL
ncbi:probable protein phosphatase 2C 45 [Cyclospora cayetanensis]|uniref:Probable protein phosphatase 2C 45 n=1 Tax=Cyclospora cayetanensis TaxID=88456 RepID=A0A6P6RXH0_9EIME|nr:probable protein phosphatase 2C 45 [Cyclospora cayetanensis]